MEREKVKQLLPLIQAYAEGKEIEMYDETEGGWVTLDSPRFDYEPETYRVKPEYKYRSFSGDDECWDEMRRHEPLGWVTVDGMRECILSVDPDGVMVGDFEDGNHFFVYMAALDSLKFIDGKPFGVKKED